MKFKTKLIFKNRKTGFSVDFGVCPLMYRTNTGSFKSDTCPSCYSTRLLSVYPATAKKLETIQSNPLPPIRDFIEDINKIKKLGNRFIRFYSLGDFINKDEIEFIHAAANILPVELFSKTLHLLENRDNIIKIAAHQNVHISLSMNKTFVEKSPTYIEDLFKFLVDNKLLRNVQINYTFIGDEEVRKIPYISVYHTTKNNKLELFEKLGYNRSCCARSEDGTRITDKNSGNHKGSCAKCPLCKLPAANANGDILVPKLQKKLYES